LAADCQRKQCHPAKYQQWRFHIDTLPEIRKRQQVATESHSQQDRCNVGALRALLLGMIRKLKSGEFRLYSRKKDAKSGRRRNLGTFSTREAAENHERAVQFFKHGG
jgi:hypothetical protein